MKHYEIPELEVVKIDTADIICNSPALDDNETPMDKET